MLSLFYIAKVVDVHVVVAVVVLVAVIVDDVVDVAIICLFNRHLFDLAFGNEIALFLQQ